MESPYIEKMELIKEELQKTNPDLIESIDSYLQDIENYSEALNGKYNHFVDSEYLEYIDQDYIDIENKEAMEELNLTPSDLFKMLGYNFYELNVKDYAGYREESTVDYLYTEVNDIKDSELKTKIQEYVEIATNWYITF